MSKVQGQHDGRTERVRQTANWLNAQPLHDDGTIKTLDPEPDMHVIHSHVGLIQASIDAGVSQIIVSEPNGFARDAIKQMLSSDELSKCVFEPDDPPEEGEVEVKQTNTPILYPVRDSTRPGQGYE